MSEVDFLLAQLHDIEGLDPIGIWPLAVGWWIIIGFGIAILSLVVWYLIKWLAFRRSWRYDSLQKLNHLLEHLSGPSVTDAAIHSVAVLLSEYLRRIALRLSSRSECAGLTGQAWLEWLSKHDVKKFDWVNQGELLIQAPYAPANHGWKVEHLRTLIHAAKEWVS